MDETNLPKAVVIGGGTGLSVLLRGLKKFPVDITAIVTVADDGGSSGRLRDEFDIPPPGDVRNVITALSEVEPLLEGLMQHRFKNGNGLSGHSLGNLMLAAMTDITGDFVKGVREMCRVLNVRGEVLPASNQSIVLHAEMRDGTFVQGESQIPKVNKAIKRVFLSPSGIKALPESIRAIREADLIVLGPGSLYTSILPNLLVPGIAKEIQQSKARKVYVCNVMTQLGETENYTASDHVQALIDHIGYKLMDTIIVNEEMIPSFYEKRYAQERAEVVQYDENRLKSFGFHVISDKIIQYDEKYVRHDAKKISSILLSLLDDKRS
ncbi:YvcK family protein [Bacillus sp. N1-1]|uniref:gluconeogenesis factor YvcK family protein n=1 Tax=Bacillus sp. N1-1 TaxID=2682541 RepID=UPI0013184073|nr:YvcK family protein [Bacillus sp. N1-1]QHA93355.1 uridine diphosphate-N-acetylglucosamine-binding protein YvcK [Bacillus sp. N1-1]